jgi:hypothetical protein
MHENIAMQENIFVVNGLYISGGFHYHAAATNQR